LFGIFYFFFGKNYLLMQNKEKAYLLFLRKFRKNVNL
jgi:hypothetical protein